MLNIEDFVQRMQLLMDYYNISASVFADRLTVQRSSLSHLMGGRNKPSLDFVMRITEAYPEADLYWLLYGKGEFPKSSAQPQATEISEPTIVPVREVMDTGPDLFSVSENGDLKEIKESESSEPQEHEATPPTLANDTATATANSKEIERIVMFYNDGTFKNYVPGR